MTETRSVKAIPSVTRKGTPRSSHWDDHIKKALAKRGKREPVHVVVLQTNDQASNAAARLRARAAKLGHDVTVVQRLNEVFVEAA